MSSGRGQDHTPLSAVGARKPSAQVARKLPPDAGLTCRRRAPRASASSSPATRCGHVNWRAGAISGGAERISADQFGANARFVWGLEDIRLELFQGPARLLYFKCSQPPGWRGVRVPSAVMRVICERLRPARRISPMQVSGMPAMARGTEADGG